MGVGETEEVCKLRGGRGGWVGRRDGRGGGGGGGGGSWVGMGWG